MYYQPRQVMNIMQKVYTVKYQTVENASGELNYLFDKLQQLNEINKGQWKTSFWYDKNNVLCRFFWMSPY